MTIFEMLEMLEAEIVSLQNRNLQLQTSISQYQSSRVSSPVQERTKRPVKKASASKRKNGQPVPAKRKVPKNVEREEKAQQLELTGPGEPPGEEQPSRTLGKRQALGKSLLQLRKMSALRSQQLDANN